MNIIRNFFRRIKNAWVVLLDPSVSAAVDNYYFHIRAEAERAAEQKVFYEIAPNVINKLLPEGRWEHARDGCTISLRVECKEIIGSKEADQVLDESRMGTRVKLAGDI